MTRWEVFTWRPLNGPRCSPFRLLPSPCVASPSALRLRFFGNWSPSPSPSVTPPLLLRGVTDRGGGGGLGVGSLSAPPSPSFHSARGGGGATGASTSGSRVASFSIYSISFQFYINNFRIICLHFRQSIIIINYYYSFINW